MCLSSLFQISSLTDLLLCAMYTTSAFGLVESVLEEHSNPTVYAIGGGKLQWLKTLNINLIQFESVQKFILELKGMLTAVDMLLFGFFPTICQQAVVKDMAP